MFDGDETEMMMMMMNTTTKSAINAATSTTTKVHKGPSNLLVLSLGNPSEYDGTRHSVGHYVLKKLISRYRCQDVRVGRFNSFVSRDNHGCDIWFYRVPGFMNLSGKSVSPFFEAFCNQQNEKDIPVVILFDELDVDLGKVKVRKMNSSHRGHNGLRSIQANSKIGKKYTGLQIGIGRNYSGDKNTPGVVANYVLSKFKNEEKEVLDDIVTDRVKDILDEMCEEGKYINEKL